MDEDIFPDYDVMSANKTDSTSFKKLLRSTSPSIVNNIDNSAKESEESEIKRESLTTKTAVEFLLEGKLKSAVCRYCLHISPALSELDQVLQIAGSGALYKVTIREIIACFYPFKVNEDPNFPEKICQNCVDRALNAYLFTQQCERAERALLNCFTDIYEKFDKLDPINRPKKRGRQKLNPNYNIIHAEHEKVIDYAEPIMNIINIGAESVTKEPDWNEFECKKCWQVLPNMESLLNHEITHPKFMWYHCRLCGKSFPKLIQLKKHHTQVHVHGKGPKTAPESKFHCNQCGNVSDSYSEHLQHVEKHKFKRVMQDIIEKKTDKLCLVCLDKGADLVELDKMVCVHGGHPELMGDKTLYTILASTLPDNKPYKYRELHVPHKAKIMTINKRKRNFDEIDAKNIFVLTLPTVITEDTFKTNHFYSYVFCEPKLTDITNNDDENNDSPKVIEIVEEADMTDNNLDTKEIKTGSLTYPTDLIEDNTCMDASLTHDKGLKETNKNIEKDTVLPRDDNLMDFEVRVGKRIISDEPNNTTESKSEEINQPIKKRKYSDDKTLEKEEITKPMDMEKEIVITKEKPDYYCFSNPSLENTYTNVEGTTDNKYTFKFTKPDYAVTNTKDISKEITPLMENINEVAQPINNDPNLSWLFSKSTKTSVSYKGPENVTKAKENGKCNLCWVFKHLKQCEYCKKPIENDQINEVIPDTAIETVDIPNTEVIESKNQPDKEYIKINKSPSWQCKICLSENNSDRLTCVCCESNKYIENSSIKINFGNHHNFVDHKKENFVKDTDECSENEKTIKEEKNEEEVMIYNEIKIDESLLFNDLYAQMDVEPDIIKDEEMDVEENPSISNAVHNSYIPMPNAQVYTPYFVRNFQFNIGSPGTEKGKPRKLRASRNMSRAFHK